MYGGGEFEFWTAGNDIEPDWAYIEDADWGEDIVVTAERWIYVKSWWVHERRRRTYFSYTLCPRCEGEGELPDDTEGLSKDPDMVDCPVCEGSGEREEKWDHA